MREILAYIVVYGSSAFMGSDAANEIQKKVMERVKEGYYPYGSISCIDSESGFIKCYQPMVKYKEVDND